MVRRVGGGALLGGAALVATVAVTPPGSTALDLVWLATAAVVLLAIRHAVRTHPLRRERGWGALALAVVLLGASSILALTAQPLLGLATYLLSFLMVGVALFRLASARMPQGDPEGAIDALIVTIATAAVLFDRLVAPTLAEGVSLQTYAISGALPLVQAFILASVVRLLFTGTYRLPAAWALATAAMAVFAANLTFLLNGAIGVPLVGRLLYAVSWTALAYGVLHPSAAELSRPADTRSPGMAYGRLAVVGAALVVLPITTQRGSSGLVSHVPAVAATLCVALVLWCLARLLVDRERDAASLRHRAEREAALSTIATAAVTSSDVEAFTRVVADGLGHALHAAVNRHDAVVAPASDHDSDDRLMALSLGPAGHLSIHPTTDAPFDHDDRRFVATAQDVVSGALRRWQAEAQLRHRSSHDELTGLPNRSAILEALRGELPERPDERPERRDPAGPSLAVLFLDLDGFKSINDTWGHEAGDAALIEVSRRLRETVRPGDRVGRLAGDEFVVLCKGVDADDATAIAERLCEALDVPLAMGPEMVGLGGSIGLALAHPGDRPDRILNRADAAMYDAKRSSEHRVRRWSGDLAELR